MITVGLDQLFGLAGFALTAIRALLDDRASRDAVAILDAIEKVYGAVDDAAVGKVTAIQAADSIQYLVTRLRANDAAADAALAKKFPESGR